MYMCTCVCVYTHIYIYIYTHTHVLCYDISYHIISYYITRGSCLHTTIDGVDTAIIGII